MHAYVVLAHRDLGQLTRLIRTLDTGQAYFFLHIDKKTNIAPYERELGEIGKLPNVRFVKRYHCPWAAFGIIKAQRAAMHAALRTNPRFTHITLLTGQDYPIKPPHEIDSFFDANRGTSFIRFFEGTTRKHGIRLGEPPHQGWRYKNWYWYFAGRHRRVSSKLLKKVGIKRRVPGGMRPVKGWAFFTLSRECAEYALRFLEVNPRYVGFFKHVLHADEYFWHTILLNSPLGETMENRTLRYEPFEQKPFTGHGRVLRKEDLAELKAESSNRFFAKKFDPAVDSDILDLIDRHILGGTNP
ncbi:MAG: hypothetical protein AVDCRST_MAG93-4663 [uncultured Chloroflexia bacterium]|uniref:Peptide O-xylosyltransferase n=1 Tax=uncultured Chloroflexia bacterium TaxID=1672391 RepID=A0A6J4KCJ7_9CHLR|nr:MAG: hypothetical protein AVDCRST_MAG93-4663 [uncultured Chloroflexia bacterium]